MTRKRTSTARNLAVEMRSVDSITPYERNARVITEQAIDVVARSLREFGWQQPIVVDKNGVIVVGHTRYLAAKRLGMREVPVHVMHAEQRLIDAYRLMDNRSNQESSWDSEKLVEELAELQRRGYDLANTGFTAEELEAHLRALREEASESDNGGPAADRFVCPRCKRAFTL